MGCRVDNLDCCYVLGCRPVGVVPSFYWRLSWQKNRWFKGDYKVIGVGRPPSNERSFGPQVQLTLQEAAKQVGTLTSEPRLGTCVVGCPSAIAVRPSSCALQFPDALSGGWVCEFSELALLNLCKSFPKPSIPCTVS